MDQATKITVEQRLRRWLAVFHLALPLLWFSLAACVTIAVLPTALSILERGQVEKISLASFQIELRRVNASEYHEKEKTTQAVGSLKKVLPLKEEEIKHLANRLEQLQKKIRGTSVLWVDDNHPYQNADLRRVLTGIGMDINSVTSTDEALKWMSQTTYDIVITDLDRKGQPPAPCYTGSKHENAGCDLLRKMGVLRGQAKYPKMIVYAGRIEPSDGTPPFAMGMTNRPAALIELVFDAVAGLP